MTKKQVHSQNLLFFFFLRTKPTQNNQAFDNLAKAGGPSVSSLLSGPTSDLKKILLFHLSSTKFTDADIPPGKVVNTLLPGASLKAALSPSGRGVEIGPSSYSGKNVGPAGAGEFFFFLLFFSFFHRQKKESKTQFSFSLSLLFSFPLTINRRVRRQGLHLPRRRRAHPGPAGREGCCLKGGVSLFLFFRSFTLSQTRSLALSHSLSLFLLLVRPLSRSRGETR